jgi:pimeloyl-ACP methyl ester carboxylesterase
MTTAIDAPFPIAGAELHVAAPEGDGEPLVLIHGAWTDHATWNLVVPHLEAFRVIRYDRRGHSRSTRGDRPATRRRHEDDLAALIEALDAGPVHLAGGSYGALMALSLAGRRPDLVRSVVAHEPPAFALHPVREAIALFAGVCDEIAAGDAETAARRFFEEAILGPGGWALVPEPVQRAAIANAPTFADMLEDPAWDALDVAAVAAFPGRRLITYGDAGPAWLPDVARTVAKRTGSAGRRIAGAGHTPHHTHPAEFAAVISLMG